MRIHLAGLPSSNTVIQSATLSQIESHLTTYAHQSEVLAKEKVFEEMRIHLADTTARLHGDQTIKRLLPDENKPEALFSYAYSEQEEQWRESWTHAMKIHLAGHTATPDMENQVKPDHDTHLTTYADRAEVSNTISDSANRTDLRPRVIIDSGAFTAWSTGKTIRPQDYAEWALDFDKRWRHKMASLRYINLDYIPGKKGVNATPEQLKEAVIKSQQNADLLRTMGLDPVIEVFHQDEPFELLKKLEERRNGGCIALSPRNDVSVLSREKWLKQVLAYCVKTFGKDGIPPAHGLAVTSDRLLRAFPFFSADSSSWVSCLRFGGGGAAGLKQIPRYKDGDAAMAATIHTLRSEIRKYKEMEYNITKLWSIRGINWDESKIR